ncbi:MAG TPA: hypothetical protein VK402_00265 [Blastococcus sp.]|nr:hypothetical protein [Blastococcus sp.]
MRRAVWPVAAALLAGGCVAPAPTTADYESKAAMAADAAVSEARTAVLAADAYVHGRLTAAYLEPVLVDAEEALGSVRATFDSVQPPATAGADALRETLDPLLEDAGSAVTDLRIAARRDARDDLADTAAELSDVADDLEAFGTEHAT